MPPKRRDAITYGKPRKRRALPLSLFNLATDDDFSPIMSWIPAKHNPEPLVPKRPDSQRAATMAVEPDQSSVEMLCGITGCDENTARRYLKAKHNDLDGAMNAFYDGEDISKIEQSTQWDESAWSADREGNQNLHPLGASAAPTRGPSPAPSLGLTQPNTKADEDQELARALAASRGDEMPYMQESGVVNQDGSEQKFGPANRPYYDQAQWAMVPASQEIVPDPPAKEREYDGQGPRFLKHLPDGDYTPNLITICHSIAKLREAFLLRGYVKNDYGSEPDWWKGYAIPMPRIVHTTDGSAAEPDLDNYDELIAECQRLMVFLDCSQRTYASTGGITSSKLISDNEVSSSRPGSLLEIFLQGWMEGASRRIDAPEAVQKLFTTTVGTNASSGMSDTNMRVIELDVKNLDENTDLFELMDGLLWDTDPNDDEMPDNFIEDPAEFLVIRAQHTSPRATKLGLDVPAAFHIDKYLKDNIASTRSIRQQMIQGRKRVAKIEAIEKKLKNWQHPKKSAQLEARQLLNHAHGHFSGQNREAVDKADLTNKASLPKHELPHYPDVASKLEQIVASIDKKLEVLAEEKEKARKAISQLSKAPPPDLQASDLHPRYTLRGVATKPNITYVLRPKEDGDEDTTTNNDDDTTPAGHQWWRIDYEVSGASAKIMRTKAGDYDVLRAVELEHTSALLVYGNDESCDREEYYNESLPEALKEFVEKDNIQFQQEVKDAELPSYNIINDMSDFPRKSIERTSMDSLKVGGGDSDDEGGLLANDELAQQHHAYGLGYDVKPSDRPRTPVEEIHLSEADDLFPMEMVQKPGHKPLVPRPGTAGGDTAMSGVESQDGGVGGATHVEDVVDSEMK